MAGLLYGDVCPSGRLPVTFYRSDRDLPPFTDYSMKDRTYKYFQGEPLYPFAHGLSYTSFALEDLRFDGAAVEGVLRNTGSRRGGHAIPVFLKDPGDRTVNCRLAGLTRLELDPGEAAPFRVELCREILDLFDDPAALTVLVDGEKVQGRGKR